jgi:hypothetical protein
MHVFNHLLDDPEIQSMLLDSYARRCSTGGTLGGPGIERMLNGKAVEGRQFVESHPLPDDDARRI